ncbi:MULTISPECIES: type II secretion system protein [unclassified Sulfuricurvum]|uniref:type II secretion system protein n=1 Tax=unclassified Sulfuricurvum TaxID=2632390 RepID=UPI000A749CCC|nr:MULTISPECIES: prepilin-type N-terminal cleavage/methylation domain-containing protein [unclassified Sulfuricurvum]
MKRFAFTMIELVFVIVVLGILAAIAIPRLAATRDDAEIAKGRSDVSAIRAAIVSERQGRLLQGNTAFIATLDDADEDEEGETLFDNNNLLMYGITSANRNGHWMKSGPNAYDFKIMGTDVTFDYNATTGRFDCTNDADDTECDLLTN